MNPKKMKIPLNITSMQDLNVYDIISHTLLLTPHEDDQNLWLCILRIIYYNEAKSAQDSGHIQFICSINDYYYEYNMLYNNITNNIVHKKDK